MKLRAITRTTVDTSLRLARLPVEIAIGVLPDGGTGFRSAALAGVDRTDAFVRAVFGVTESPATRSESPQPTARRSEAAQRPRPKPAPPRSQEPPQPPAHEPGAPSQEAIATRAYELYKRGVPGNPEEHWQIAERELHEAPPGPVGV